MNTASKGVAWERIIPPATLLLVSLLVAGPLWGPGLVNTRGGGDSPFLLLRTHQLAENLRAGVFPARWMPDAAYGLGYPFFSYYAALPYYAAASLELLGLDILTAIKLTQTLFLAVAALAMYHWAEQVLRSRLGAWLAALAYTAAPFHLVNLYVRGDALSEFAAFTFYPLIFWGFDRLAAKPSLRRALFTALAYAGLIVTHNVSALIFSPFVLLYAAFHIGRMTSRGQDRGARETIHDSLLLSLPLLIALLLSAWFWLPALAETNYVQLTAQTTGYFFYGNHFRDTDLVQGTLAFDYATGQDATSAFAAGLVQTSLALIGALVVCFTGVRSRVSPRERKTTTRPRRQDRHQDTMRLGFVLLGLLLSTWLITPLSRPLWDHLPLLSMAQFPWRFLSIQAFFAAALTGAAVAPIRAQQGHLAWAIAATLGVILIAAALVGLRPTYLPIRADDVTAERLQLYELFTGNIGSTIRYEYLPTWVKPRPYTGPAQFSPDVPPRAIPLSGTLLGAERVERQPTRRVWHVEAGSEGAEVALPIYYWPGWRAVVDGTRIDVRPAAGSGYVSLSIPPGRHKVEVNLGRTPLRAGAEGASLITALTMLALGIRGWEDRRREGREDGGQREGATGKRQPSTMRSQHAAIAYLPFVAILALVVAVHPRVPSTENDDLTMDFGEMPYLHHNPDGVRLGGWRLTSYRYESADAPTAQRIAPGETLQVTMTWERDEDRPATTSPDAPTQLQLTSPGAVRHDEISAIATAAIDLDQPEAAAGLIRTTNSNLSVPPHTAPGAHLLRVGVPSPVYLRPVWIEADQPSTQEPVHATFADGALRLHDVRAMQAEPDRLHVQLDWSATKPVGANYGLSLGLTDAVGYEWLRQGEHPGYDTQPGHGFLPTSLWPLDRVMADHHAPALLTGAPPSDAYTLTIDLYHVATWKSVGQHKVTVALTETASRPNAPTLARFGNDLALSRLEIRPSISQGEELEVLSYWSTTRTPTADYVVDWSLQGPDQTISSTQPLAPGSSPRSWPSGAWIAGRAALTIPPTSPPGEYTLSLTLREPTGGTPVGSYTHPSPVTIKGRERVWELPEMEQSVGARFGDMIELAGYDLRQNRESLQLTFHWQALTTPDRHYMLFVHLADPETGEPATQADTMPRGFTYPTGQWVPGEVVTDDVELSTRDVAAGRYDLAVGWYDPDTKQRLQVVDREGMPLPDNRLILPSSIVLP